MPQIVEDAVTIIPKEHISERKFVEDVPVPQIQEQILEVANVFPPELISERIIEQVHDVPVPLIQEQILEVAEISPRRRIPERIVEHTSDVPAPQIREQIVEVVKNIPQERISERIAEQIVDVPTPQILEEIVEAISAPHEQVQQQTVKQINDAMKKEEMAWRRADRARKRICQQYYSSRSSRSDFQ